MEGELAATIVKLIRNQILNDIAEATVSGADHDPWDELNEGAEWCSNELTRYELARYDQGDDNAESYEWWTMKTVAEVEATLSQASRSYLRGQLDFLQSTQNDEAENVSESVSSSTDN